MLSTGWLGRSISLLPLTLVLVPLLTGCPRRPPVDTREVALELVAEGLTAPVYATHANDGSGRLFVVDQVGQVRIVDADGDLLAEPFVDVADRLVDLDPAYDERGLLGLAFHPDYAQNGRFFLYYTAPPGPQTPAGFEVRLVLAEWAVSVDDPNAADPASERILLEIDKPQTNHNGGTIAFGPDGVLYLGTGDGGGADDNDFGHTPDLGNAQDKSQLLGKILRIDVDAGDPYAIPDDNPFINEAGARPEIYALGLRNPYRFSFDTGGQRRLLAGDAGQNLFEEVNIITRGGNYGWHIREGLHCFDPDDPLDPPAQCPQVDADGDPLIDPILEYPHSGDDTTIIGHAVIGGFVYRGTALPDLVGDYVFGDLAASFLMPSGAMLAAEENDDGTWDLRELGIAGRADGRLNEVLLGFGQDDEGEMYVLTSGRLGPGGSTGKVYRLVAVP